MVRSVQIRIRDATHRRSRKLSKLQAINKMPNKQTNDKHLHTQKAHKALCLLMRICVTCKNYKLSVIL